jgi:type II secretory ATPase GspE/PulE/Tfp pilus assembly ATPase PilB-like protein
MVLSTLHTNSAPGAISRLLDMGLEPFLITASVNMIMAQRLPRRLCKECRNPLPETHPDVRKVREILRIPAEQPIQIFGPKEGGCQICRGLGYKGRMGIFEVLEMDDTLRELVIKGSSTEELTATARARGMMTLLEHGASKVLEGRTSLDEIYRVV